MNDDLAYILGVLAGDGYVDEKGGHYKSGVIHKRYGICLQTTNQEFARSFTTALERWSGKKPQIRKFDRTFNHRTAGKAPFCCTTHYFEVRLYSKQHHEEIKKYEIKGVPKEICGDPHLIISWIRGFYDSDGYYGYREKNHFSSLTMANTNTPLLESIQKLLSELGIKSHIYRYAVEIHDKQNLGKFKELVGRPIGKIHT